MIPPTSKAFLVKDLASGRDYHLCVLAVYDDGVTSLTATRSLGCTQFSTPQDGLQCHSLHTQFLGGTMIIIIGGIIVASVLVFIIILMIRYKVYSGQDEHKKAKARKSATMTQAAPRFPRDVKAPLEKQRQNWYQQSMAGTDRETPHTGGESMLMARILWPLSDGFP
ncbi:hypothetical protein JD844_006043 [Phrynosoma platyrhinos]|uniref:Leucine-rich repeat and fibronectin type III domain-containing protein 1 n=1 Tax=Phrynosoma platyrhinos TaxID=52577 RepID=A0ABQ7TQ55_PHRPL|nr:hypothetical protein JD844_006043 [Phrynosoma platyrhinos]